MNPEALTNSLGGVWYNGRGQAPCPVCQPERRRDQNALSISGNRGKLLLHCFKSNCSFVDIAIEAGANLGHAQINFEAQSQHEKKRHEYQLKRLRQARELWGRSKPIKNTKGEAYLRSRGVTCTLPESLRFIADIHHAPTMNWCSAIFGLSEPTCGVHRTFLTKRREKLSKGAKLMLGPCAGGAVRLSEGHKRLVVCARV